MLPKQLMFTVGLVDQITKPIAKISQQFNGLTNNYQQGTIKMASGIAGIAASGYALQNALMPAIEMDRALGEVKSLGVRESALKTLTDTSYEFALKYGKSATEFIGSSYDIQSAISGLNDADLSAFTLSSNVLAAATKADAATITNYMGTMYGIFKNQAIGMGKSNWIEQVTGMTATAVKMFKTTGDGMSSAFTSVGAEATSYGIGMNEQMAVLGTLQSQMSGSESGTKYKAFLSGVGKAQESLGLIFEDSQGQMLPMVDILNKIKGKYGETINLAEGMELKDAFGSTQAVGAIKALIADVDGLHGSIKDLGKVKGMEQAEKMAAAMTDQSERLSQSWFVIRAAFGTAILPVFNSFAGWLADVGRDLVSFTERFPNLTKYLGYLAVGILGAVAAGGLLTVIMGASNMAMVAWGVVVIAKTAIVAALTSGLAFLRGAMLAVNIAMYANPIGMIVAGIAAAVVAVGALIYYWDDLKATMGEWGWIKAISGVFSSVWGGIKNIFNSTIEWIIEKINLIPGVDIALNASPMIEETKQARDTKALPNNVVNFVQPLPNSIAPMENSIIPLALKSQNKQEHDNRQQNSVVPFTQPVVPTALIEKPQQNIVIPFAQPVAPQLLPNNVPPIANNVMPAALSDQSNQVREINSRPDNFAKLPGLKLERNKTQPNITNSSHANSTDNSKKVFIENITLKSDDISRDLSQLLELAG